MGSNADRNSDPRADMMASLTLCTARTIRPPIRLSRQQGQRHFNDVHRSVRQKESIGRNATSRAVDAPSLSLAPPFMPTGATDVKETIPKQQPAPAAVPHTAAPTTLHVPTPLSSSSRMFPSMVPSRLPLGGPGPRQTVGPRKPAIVWFRNDLRVHDHEPLVTANTEGSAVVPVYCFDPRDIGASARNFDRAGPYRARFLIGAVSELRESLRALGSDLLVRVGHPEEVIPKLAAQVGAGAVYCHAEVTDVDMQMDRSIRSALTKLGAELKASWGNSLLHPDDLPFALQQTPMQYGKFQEGAAGVRVRESLEAPQKLRPLPRVLQVGEAEVGSVVSMESLGYSRETVERCEEDCTVVAGLKGGEAQGLLQLQQRLHDITRHLTHPSAPLPNLSVDLNPWVVTGCLSLRHIHQALGQHLAALGQQLPPQSQQQVVQPLLQHQQCHRRQRQEMVGSEEMEQQGQSRAIQIQPQQQVQQRHGEQYLTAFHWREFFRCLNRRFSMVLSAPTQGLHAAADPSPITAMAMV